MPVLTPRLNLTEAQQAFGNHFEVVTLTDIAQGDDADEKKLLLTFLHGRRSGEPVRFKQWRGIGPSAKSSLQQQDKYDRFLLLGSLDPPQSAPSLLLRLSSREFFCDISTISGLEPLCTY